MKINDVLRRKGNLVATVTEQATVTQLLEELASHDIGALIVTGADGGIVGIVSERDIVRHLHRHGPHVLDSRADALMTRVVNTASGDDTVEQAMRTMTDHRVRHLPVVDSTGLIGIVGIGDVVKSRIDELQATTDQLQTYIAGN
ncbi:MAG: histidine kinase [Pseudonocardiales bacterium]|nr:histidine kinase [Pseudonocardiales bacterium]